MAIKWICINKDRLFKIIMKQKPIVKVKELFLGQDAEGVLVSKIPSA